MLSISLTPDILTAIQAAYFVSLFITVIALRVTNSIN